MLGLPLQSSMEIELVPSVDRLSGHELQDICPIVSWYVPLGHELHSSFK